MTQPKIALIGFTSIPSFFEIDSITKEATGTVAPFCSDVCHDAAQASLYSDSKKHRPTLSPVSDFAGIPQCEHCGAEIYRANRTAAELADHAYSEFDFGSDFIVTDTGSWSHDNSASPEWSRSVYGDYEGNTVKLTFVVRFADNGVIAEAYARDEHGDDWGTSLVVPLASRPGDIILIEKYVSDGPGYAGSIRFSIGQDKVTVNYLKDDTEFTISNGVHLPVVTAVRDCADSDLNAVWQTFDSSMKDYLDEPHFIETERVKILQFADGSAGYLIIWGDSSLFSILQGVFMNTFEVSIGANGRKVTSHTLSSNDIPFVAF